MMPTPVPPAALTRRTWVLLAGLIILAALLRLAYFWWWSALPGAAFIDPDEYLGQGRRLIDRHGEWRWTIEAVRYESSYFKAPLYPLFLSVFARWSPWPYEWSATMAEIGLSVSLVGLAFWLGRLCHSTRAGLVAAGLQAVDMQQIQLVTVFRQEEVYVPLAMLGLAALGTAIHRHLGPWHLLAAGATMGVASLARSMPLLFVAPAMLVLWLAARRGRPALLLVVAYLAGFLLVVVPYSASLSARAGRTVIIENIGSYGWLQGQAARFTPPSLFGTLRLAADRLSISQAAGLIDGSLRLSGGRSLQTMTPVADPADAWRITSAVRIGDDALTALVLVAAPLGLLVAWRQPLAWLAALWIAANMAGFVAAGYSGPRFRSPFMLPLIVLAATLVAALPRLTGRFSRQQSCGRLALAVTLLAGTLALTGASIVARSAPRSFAGQVDYGIEPWQMGPGERSTTTTGRAAAFTVYPADGSVRVRLRARDQAPVNARVQIDGLAERHVVATADGVDIVERLSPEARFAFVRLAAEAGLQVTTP